MNELLKIEISEKQEQVISGRAPCGLSVCCNTDFVTERTF